MSFVLALAENVSITGAGEYGVSELEDFLAIRGQDEP